MTFNEPFKIKNCTRDTAEAIQGLIHNVLQASVVHDDDKLMMAALGEVKEKLDGKLIKFNSSYNLKLSPVQAISLRMLYTFYVNDVTSYLGIKLHQIACDVHKKYNV